ncbi:hypothetical protein C1752_13894 [Acaryochloris thomasi RCC1774]|uniref:Uncharacterized protein n=1 Tax=Acaryochloris thomasi RCC1774 TaxID=1764569 RepID=A0A2W1J762_9CYAN|nr:hypothetical protein C1752_13894 [Acaryochloris thomasi RCC1774]
MGLELIVGSTDYDRHHADNYIEYRYFVRSRNRENYRSLSAFHLYGKCLPYSTDFNLLKTTDLFALTGKFNPWVYGEKHGLEGN